MLLEDLRLTQNKIDPTVSKTDPHGGEGRGGLDIDSEETPDPGIGG